MMNDLISRQAAIDAVRTYYDEQYAHADSIEDLIEKLPSADAVEVVRCKDCAYRDHDRCEIWEYCKVPDTGYCYEGVKK